MCGRLKNADPANNAFLRPRRFKVRLLPPQKQTCAVLPNILTASFAGHRGQAVQKPSSRLISTAWSLPVAKLNTAGADHGALSADLFLSLKDERSMMP